MKYRSIFPLLLLLLLPLLSLSLLLLLTGPAALATHDVSEPAAQQQQLLLLDFRSRIDRQQDRLGPHALWGMSVDMALPEAAIDTTRSNSTGPNSSKLCPLCVQVMGQSISQLLNIILNGGVVGTCAKLCGKLDKHGQLVVVGCNLVCDVVGIKVFISLVKKADLNPVWLCQQVKLCPVRDCTLPECARFGSTDVQPASGRKGTTFSVMSEFEVLGETGTGEFLFQVLPVGAPLMTLSQLVPDGFQRGVYNVKVDVPIKDQRGGDHPIVFLPGVYQGAIAVCQGICGSRRPHTRLLAQTRFNFTVTP